MTRIVGIGAGGHAKVVLDVLTHIATFEVVGLTDAHPARIGTRVLGYPVVGDDGELPRLRQAGVEAAFVGVGALSAEGTQARARLFRRALESGFQVPTLIDPRAAVSRTAVIGPGCVILANAVIGAEVRMGANITVYPGTIVEHDCVIRDHVHFSPGVVLAGGVVVGEGAFLGVGATIVQGVTIGAWATVGAGAVVVDDVPAGLVVAGVPARPLSEPPATAQASRSNREEAR